MRPDLCANITAIAYALPQAILDNKSLSARFPEWNVEKIESKTGIRQRHITGSEETALDLGVEAANNLLAEHPGVKDKIDGLLFCTQSPDYCLPPNACLAQHQLGLRTDIPATDFSLGCSGFIFGLSLAKGWITSQQARCVLLITAETYSKYLAEGDKSVRTIFGDGAAAILIELSDRPGLEHFVFSTDGSGGPNLIVPQSGVAWDKTDKKNKQAYFSNGRTPANLYMNGAELFNFTLRCVPDLLNRCLEKSGLFFEDIDHFILHQANRFMLEHLRTKCCIPEGKFIIDFEDTGNTVSPSIPIALKRSIENRQIKSGETLFLAGFGVGYSAAAVILNY